MTLRSTAKRWTYLVHRWLGIGGCLLMLLWFLFPRSKPFFRGESLNRETPVLVPDDPSDYRRSIDRGLA